MVLRGIGHGTQRYSASTSSFPLKRLHCTFFYAHGNKQKCLSEVYFTESNTDFNTNCNCLILSCLSVFKRIKHA